MGLRHITPIVLLIIQLYGLSLAADLYKLPNNRLAEGADRNLPNAEPIHCGFGTPRKVTTTTYKSLGAVLLSGIFASDAITSGALAANSGPRPGAGTKYRFAEFHGAKVLYALEIDPAGEQAYWLPQGGVIDIYQHPKPNQPVYMGTPDMTGCSCTVTPMSNGMLRVRHVEGGREREQFNDLTEAQKGGPTTYAMQYKDYGYIVTMRHLVSNVPAYVFMHYADGKWIMKMQQKTCTPETGGYGFNEHNLLNALIMNESKTTYPAISGTRTWTIPT